MSPSRVWLELSELRPLEPVQTIHASLCSGQRDQRSCFRPAGKGQGCQAKAKGFASQIRMCWSHVYLDRASPLPCQFSVC